MWTDNLQTIVFSRIKYDNKMLDLQTKYPDFTLTTEMVSSAHPTFPTLVLQQLQTPETGQDLENITVNAVNAGFQVDVIDNQKTRTRVNEIITETVRILKSMRFNLSFSTNSDTQDEKRSILRATRIIASGDTL